MTIRGQLCILFSALLLGLLPLKADTSALTFSLRQLENASQEDLTGQAVVLINGPETPTGRRVAGWSYGICTQGLQIVSAERGENDPCTGEEPAFCDLDLTEEGVVVRVVLGDQKSRWLPEASFQNWEDLRITYRCSSLSCEGGMLEFCRKPIGDLKSPSTVLVEGIPVPPAPGGRRLLRLCAVSERVTVEPILREDGRAAVVFLAQTGVPPCTLSGWSYGLCTDGEVVLEATSSGADTTRGIGGLPPVFEVLDILPGRGVVRAVILDFMLGVEAASFSPQWEDLVVSFQKAPCGTLRLCDSEIGDPPVEAVWNSVNETTIDMLVERSPVLELCWRRGDTNFDGKINLADAINVLSCLFAPAHGVWCPCREDRANPCFEVFNVNGDDRVNIADAIYVLGLIFGRVPPPPPLP